MEDSKKIDGKAILNKINNIINSGLSFFKEIPLKKKKEVAAEGGAYFHNLEDVVDIGCGEYSPLSLAITVDHVMVQLSKEEIDYLLEHSDLTLKFGREGTILSMAIKHAQKWKLTPAQYEKLIDNCPASNPDKDEVCDLDAALSSFTLINFNNSCWIKLIKKTEQKYFNKKSMGMVSLIIFRLSEVTKNMLIGELFLDKVDFEEAKRKNLDTSILLVAMLKGTFELSLEICKRMGLVRIEETREGFKKRFKGELVIDRMDKIIEIIKIEKNINKNVGIGAKNKTAKL